MNILLLLFYRLCFICLYCTAITALSCYCDACKCLHGLGICVWFYPNKLMMMMMTCRLRLEFAGLDSSIYFRPTASMANWHTGHSCPNVLCKSVRLHLWNICKAERLLNKC